MADLIIEKTNVTALLKEKYKNFGKGWISLVVVPSDAHMDVNKEALRLLVNDFKYSCVYITLSKTSSDLEKLFKSNGINTNNIYFVDAISQMYGESKTETKRCVFTSGPLDIDSITVALKELLRTINSDKKCVFLDSITTVLLYNSLPRTIRFTQFLTQSLKSMGVDGVMVSIAKGKATESLVKELSKLCDEAVDITGGGKTLKLS
jgi:KaiC/GvpD/RAD55 family RecA-like ATPase